MNVLKSLGNLGLFILCIQIQVLYSIEIHILTQVKQIYANFYSLKPPAISTLRKKLVQAVMGKYLISNGTTILPKKKTTYVQLKIA